MISSAIGQVIGINEQYSAWSAIAVLPIFLWELLLGLWLVFKGFRTVPQSPNPRSGSRRSRRHSAPPDEKRPRAKPWAFSRPTRPLYRPHCEAATAIEKASRSPRRHLSTTMDSICKTSTHSQNGGQIRRY